MLLNTAQIPKYWNQIGHGYPCFLPHVNFLPVFNQHNHQKPSFAKCDIMKKNTAWSNIETCQLLKLVVHAVTNRCQLSLFSWKT